MPPARADMELKELAQILADWLAPADGFVAYLFGSRVRGDHRPDSDVDVRIFLEDVRDTDAGMAWWIEQNETDFAEVKAKLPGPLALHRDSPDDADASIRQAAKKPVMTIGRLVVVETPRRP